MRTAVVFGSTGLTGNALLHHLLKDLRYEKVYAVVRKPSHTPHPKLEEYCFDFKNFETLPKVPANDVFCCLGTTLKKAGSKENQMIIDRDLPIGAAKFADAVKADNFICVSSVGADKNASNFYLKTKGEMEEGVSAVYDGAVFMRPSFLLGKRKELRLGEKFGIYLFYLINPLLLGRLSKYKGVQVSMLSKAMIEACFKTRSGILHYKDFLNLI